MKIPIISFLIIFVLISIAMPVDFRWTINKHSVDSYLKATSEGSIQRQVALVALGIYSFLIIIFKKRQKIGIRNLGWLIIAFLLWATLSIIWAEDVNLTAKRILILLILSLSALASAERYSIREIIRFAFFSCGLILIMGITAELILGTFSPFEMEYRFSGVLHPNEMGLYCDIFIVSSICISLVNKRKSYLFSGLLGFIFLILTKSRTSIGIMFILLFCFFPLLSIKSKKRAFVLVITAIFLFGCVFIIEKINETSYLNKMISVGRGIDVESNYLGTLNARRGIWKEAYNYISVRPFTGYGYGGFWTNRRLAELTMNQRWVFGTAHSDYIEIALNLGLIGALLYYLIIFKATIEAFNQYRKTISVRHCFCFIVITWFVLNSFFASTGIQPAIPQFLTITVLARLSFFKEVAKEAGP